MDVKPGYKQTEVGVIPEDWEVVAAEKLSRQSRQTPPKTASGTFEANYRLGL